MTEQRFEVVVNGDGQYSMWPEGNPIPAGWASVGFTGTRAAALEHMTSLHKPSQELLDFLQQGREIGERFRAQEKAKEEERLRRLAEIARERGGG
jgi:uncharacterized protein YbdZ (MbtH family)